MDSSVIDIVISPEIDVQGTHLQGYIEIDYQTLVDRLGPPTYICQPRKWDEEDGTKTNWEWYISAASGDGVVIATLYNWKTWGTYDPKFVGTWHIGGHDERAVALVKYLLADVHNVLAA